MHEGYTSYVDTDLVAAIQVASSLDLVLLMLDALHTELIRLSGHIAAQRFAHKATSVSKCIRILNGLLTALNDDEPTPLMNHLAQLYDYCIYRLNLASLHQDTGMVDEVRGLMVTLRQGWQGMHDGQKNG